jgi:hypothetical protein
VADEDLFEDEQKAHARASRRDHNERQAELNDLTAIMNMDQGRRFMRRLLGKCGVYQTSFNPDALVMAFNEGRRDVGLEYLADMAEHCQEQWVKMENEYRNRQKQASKDD